MLAFIAQLRHPRNKIINIINVDNIIYNIANIAQLRHPRNNNIINNNVISVSCTVKAI